MLAAGTDSYINIIYYHQHQHQHYIKTDLGTWYRQLEKTGSGSSLKYSLSKPAKIIVIIMIIVIIVMELKVLIAS